MNASPLLRVEPLLPTDMRACAAIMAGSDPWRTLGVTLDTALHRFMADPCPTVVARPPDHDEPLGFIRYRPQGFIDRFAYIHIVAVSEAARGQRVGEALMARVEEVCFATTPHLFLFCSSFNEGAQRFYRRLGYRQVGDVPQLIHPEHGELLFMKSRPA
ncbi:MAG: GNAT family N-acetyltransferase [Myxococcota bacterium]